MATEFCDPIFPQIPTVRVLFISFCEWACFQRTYAAYLSISPFLALAFSRRGLFTKACTIRESSTYSLIPISSSFIILLIFLHLWSLFNFIFHHSTSLFIIHSFISDQRSSLIVICHYELFDIIIHHSSRHHSSLFSISHNNSSLFFILNHQSFTMIIFF